MSRSIWKGPNCKNKIQKSAMIFANRSVNITPNLFGLTFFIHNGKELIKVEVTKEMIGHKFGEFLPTRTKFLYKKKINSNKTLIINGTKKQSNNSQTW